MLVFNANFFLESPRNLVETSSFQQNEKNSIADILLKTRSFCEVSRTFQEKFSVEHQHISTQKSLIGQLINSRILEESFSGIVYAFIQLPSMLVKIRGFQDFSVKSWYFDSKITNWPINQLRRGFRKILLVIKVVQNSIADTLLKTRSFYEVSGTFQSKVGISTPQNH